ncbi:UNVERIFIED_CONTAM: Kinesin-like protein KIN-14P [Sesamum latifolium]|uniref:Kinesin-like protein KIN-14P n=1 Tax=Sesamum latifolium TaxID=2727402 RepID=A0AAW2Y955_9LAMI
MSKDFCQQWMKWVAEVSGSRPGKGDEMYMIALLLSNRSYGDMPFAGSMKIVLDCLLTLQTQFMNVGRSNRSDPSSRWKVLGERPVTGDTLPREEPSRFLASPPFGEDKKKFISCPLNHVGHKFHEVFQLKQGSYTDLPAAKISEMMKSNSLDNAPTQSLLSVVNGILDESIERKNGEIPHRVACLLRKVVQEIERRICTQAEHLRTQNNLFKAREEKYQSRIRVLEALATGTSEETQIVMNQLQQLKSEKNKIEEKKKVEEEDVLRLIKEKDDLNQEIANLMQELEIARSSYEQECSKMKPETRGVEATGAKVEGAEGGRAEVERAEAGGAEARRAEVGGAEVGRAEAGGAEVGRAEAGGAEVELKLEELKLDELKLEELKLDELKSEELNDELKLEELKSDELKLEELKSEELKLEKLKLELLNLEEL